MEDSEAGTSTQHRKTNSNENNRSTIGWYFQKRRRLEPQNLSNKEKTAFSRTPLDQEDNIVDDITNDVGCYIGADNIDDSIKANLLEKHWDPPSNYIFPFSIVNRNGKMVKKYAQRSYLRQFPWLVLSNKKKGFYCKYCALFATDDIQPNSRVKVLVKEPMAAFERLLGQNGILSGHQRKPFHEKAKKAAKEFLKTFQERNEIDKLMETEGILRPAVSIIEFCARQNIPLTSVNDKESLMEQDDNFTAFLKFRIGSDGSMSNCKASSLKAVRKSLIAECKIFIQKTILRKVEKAKIFSIIIDETIDISHNKLWSISFRYFHGEEIREDFVTFCNAYQKINYEDRIYERKLTGVALSRVVEDLCQDFDIDLTWCVGINFDSCSVLASETKEAVSKLCKKAIHAKQFPPYNHSLNNSLANSSKVRFYRNTSAIMKNVVDFVNVSLRRQEELKDTSLQDVFRTLRVERHDEYLHFQGDNLVKICNALKQISSWDNSKTATDAHCLQHALMTSEFLVASVCLDDVLGVTPSLSRPQNPPLDFKTVTNVVSDVVSTLEDRKKNVNSVFANLFSKAKETAGKLDVDLKTSRLANNQIHRSNNQLHNATVEEHFRKAFYIPLLDSVMADLKDRFSEDVLALIKLGVYLPKKTYTEDDLNFVRETTELYRQFLSNQTTSIVVPEFQLWIKSWERETKEGRTLFPQSLPEILNACNPVVYPNIFIMLQILASIPCSFATPELSSSSLDRVKTWLQKNIGEEELIGVALMNVHREITIDVEEIISLVKKNPAVVDLTR